MQPAWILVLSAPVPCLFQVHFYGLHKEKDAILHVKIAFLAVQHQMNVHVLNAHWREIL